MLPWVASVRTVGGPAKVCVAVPLLIFIVLMRAHLEGSTLRLHVEGSTLGITAQAIPDTLALQRPAPQNEPGAGTGTGTAGWLTSWPIFSTVQAATTQASQWMGSAAGWWLTEPSPRMGEPAPTDDAWSAVFNNNNEAASNGGGDTVEAPRRIRYIRLPLLNHLQPDLGHPRIVRTGIGTAAAAAAGGGLEAVVGAIETETVTEIGTETETEIDVAAASAAAAGTMRPVRRFRDNECRSHSR